jgi:hypothetical protein
MRLSFEGHRSDRANSFPGPRLTQSRFVYIKLGEGGCWEKECLDKGIIRFKNLRLTEKGLADRIAAYKLEHSYAGIIGKGLEPVIKPLGYDWKIGIALITSFAAREVFVGTMATIYSIGSVSDSDTATIQQRLKAEVNPETGGPRFTPAVGFSLLVFYTFCHAMYEHARDCIQGNKGMEVAPHSTYIHDSACLPFSVARISGFVLIK